MAGSRPLLRIKNVHRELTGQDLSQLFDSVAAVEFVKFDPSNDTIAYICFENNNAKNNSIAIGKYDGKKAMGREITVETTTSLADRIVLPARRDQPVKSRVNKPASSHPAKKSQARERPPKPAKKSLGDLDDELSAYMSGQAALPQEHTAPEPQSQEETPSAPVEANDEMALD